MSNLSQRPLYSLRFRFWSSLLLAGILMSADHYYTLSQKLYPIIGLPIQTVLGFATVTQKSFESIGKYYGSIERLVSDNERLQRELLQARHRAQEMQRLRDENLRLRQLMKMDILQQAEQAVVAKVTHVSTTPFQQHVAINRGSREGLYVGQPALDADGIVGQVSKVGLYQSTVLLITDSRHAMLVRSARTGDIYLAEGDSHQLKLRYVPPRNDIKEGDLMLSSGLDETYPGDYLVGRVAQLVLLPGQDFLEADIEPSSQTHRNRELLLVWPPQASPPENTPEDAS